MRLESFSLKGVTVFRERQTIDFSQLPNGLIAIVGRNGSGKTTLLESIYAALHRDLPSRPKGLSHYCHGSDAGIGLTFSVNGDVYESRLLIDAQRAKMEAFILKNGSPFHDSNGKVTVFDQAMRDVVGSRELMLSSIFSAQNKAGSFLEMRVASRTELMIELLNLGHLPAKEKAAKELADAAMVQVQANRSRLESLGDTASKIRDLNESTSVLTEQLSVAKSTGAQTRELLADANEAYAQQAQHGAETLGRWEARKKQAESDYDESDIALSAVVKEIEARESELAAARADVESRKAKIQSDLKDCDERIDGNRILLDNRSFIEEARARVPVLEAQVVEQEELLEAANRSAQLRLVLEGKLNEAKIRAKTDEDRIESALFTINEKLARCRSAFAELDDVPCHAEPPYDTCKKITDSVAMGKEVPDLIKAEAAHKEDLRQARLRSAGDVPWADGLNIKALEAELSEIGDINADHIRSKLGTLKHDLEQVRKRAARMEALENAETRIGELETLKSSLAAELGAMELPDRDMTELESRKAILNDQREKAMVDLNQCNRDEAVLAGLDHLIKEAKAWVTELEGQVESSRQEVDRIDRELTLAHANLLTATEEAAAADELKSIVDSAERDHSDWTRLQTAFGKRGIAKLEIDAAGPAISGLINELLYSCFSSRFSAQLKTQRETSDGRLIEDFDIEITDTERDRVGTIDDLSGGERVVVAEAIGVGIGIYNKGRHPLATMFRDETTGALDSETAPHYVSMLRKAMKLGDFDRCLFVTHNPDCAEMADAVIRCHEGQVTVEL